MSTVGTLSLPEKAIGVLHLALGMSSVTESVWVCTNHVVRFLMETLPTTFLLVAFSCLTSACFFPFWAGK